MHPMWTAEEAIDQVRQGRMVVVVDDDDQDTEGALVIAGQFATPDAINFMATHARGPISVALSAARYDALKLGGSTPATRQTASVGVDARNSTTSGGSAHDRARTIQIAIDPQSTPDDLTHPGHVFPLRAESGGVLARAGQTEASVDLSGMAGLLPAGVTCPVMNEDGTLARIPDLVPYCRRHRLRMVSITALIAHRRRTDRVVERVVSTSMPTAFGLFQAVGYRATDDDRHHVALVKGDVSGHADVLVCVHSECMTGDAFHALVCDCGERLETALRTIGAADRGVLLYLTQAGRGLGLLAKLGKPHRDQTRMTSAETAAVTVAPELRDFGISAQMLVDLGLTSLRVLTNTERKIVGIESYGLSITERVPLTAPQPVCQPDDRLVR